MKYFSPCTFFYASGTGRLSPAEWESISTLLFMASVRLVSPAEDQVQVDTRKYFQGKGYNELLLMQYIFFACHFKKECTGK